MKIFYLFIFFFGLGEFKYFLFKINFNVEFRNYFNKYFIMLLYLYRE